MTTAGAVSFGAMPREVCRLVALLVLTTVGCTGGDPPGKGRGGSSGAAGAGGGGDGGATGFGGSGAGSGGVGGGGFGGSPGGGGSGGGTAGAGGGTAGAGGTGGGTAGAGGRDGGGGGTGGGTAGAGGAGGATDAGGGRGGGGGGTAPGDAAANPPDPGAGCQGAVFCDDFEGHAAGRAPMGMFRVDVAGGGSLVVDTGKFFSGKQSIAIKAVRGGGYPGTWLTFPDIAPKIPSNDLHGRAMIYMTDVPGGAHWDGVMASGPLSGGGNATYVLGGMYRNFMSVYHPGDCSVDSSTRFPTGRWACIQWQFKGAKDGTHLHKMMLDGQVVQNGIQDGRQGFCVNGGARDWRAPTFSTLKVGYVHYGNAPAAIEMWIDDLAFGEQAIPCPKTP